jgi:heat shock protein HtpX
MLFSSLMLGPLLVALVACVPGIVAWWTGRRLARLADDPALPELLMAQQQRLLGVVATALAVMIVLGGTHVYWSFPLMAAGLITGRYPLRRKLLGETMGLGTYLWRSGKSVLGGWGFWVLLAWTPMIVLGIDARWWPLSLALGAVLLVWEHFYGRLWLWLNDAEPFAGDHDLAPRIEAIVERAGIKAPALYKIGARGTRYVNAIALPSISRPAIGMGNTLLELLEPDEVAGIYAHELSHIEQFSPRILRRLQMVMWLMIVVGVAAPLLVRWLAAPYAFWAPIVWPIVVLTTLVLRAKKSQQRETESDLRAAALCGDADAVARGLVKLHLHAFIPRRWPVDFERQATHPSLARRIQALRGQGDEAVASLGAPKILATARDGSMIAFDDARAWWFDGVPAGTTPDLESLRTNASSVRSVAWPELIELRVTTKGTERALRAAHRNGDNWSVPLASSQVADVQKALDLVDVRLQRELGKRPWASPALVAAAMLIAMLMSGLIGVLLVPMLLVLLRPSAASLAALGAMAIGRGALGIALDEGSWMLPRPEFGYAGVAALGIIALFLAWRRLRGETKRGSTRLTLYVIGGAGAILLAIVATAATILPFGELIDLPIMTALAVTLLGVAAAFAVGESRPARWTGAAAATAAIALGWPLLVASDRLERDAGLTRVNARLTEISRIELTGSATGLRLSPAGSRFIVQHYNGETWHGSPLTRPIRHIVGAPGGATREIDAMQIEFVDDERMLVMRATDTALELRLEPADSATTIWTASLPDLYDPLLVVSPGDRTWSVVGEEAMTDSLLVLSGTAASPDVRALRFGTLESVGATAGPYLVFNGGAKLIVPVFNVQPIRRSLAATMLMFAARTQEVELWELTPTGQRKAGEIRGFPECGQPDKGRSLCLVRDGTRARVWSLDSSGEAVPVGPLPLANIQFAAVGPGARMTLANPSDRITSVDLAARRLTDFRLPPGSGPAFDPRHASGHVAMILHEAGARSSGPAASGRLRSAAESQPRRAGGPQVVFFRARIAR